MKTQILFTILILFSITISAQVEKETIEKIQELKAVDTVGWETTGFISLLANQAYFDNWVAGGENSWAFTSLFSYNTRYVKKKHIWDFSLNAGYGKILQGQATDWIKNDDKVELNGKYGHQSFLDFYYAALLNLKTQFDDGYDYTKDSSKTSAFLAPGYGLFALGIDYMPNKKISVFASPLSSRSTFVLDQDLANQGAFGVDSATHSADGTVLTEGKRFKTEIGGYVRITANTKVVTNVDLMTKLDLYSSYTDNPQNIDVDWEVMITMKINEYFSANISTHLIYDDDIPIPIDRDGDGVYESSTAALQFKELLGVGINYKFK